MSLHKEIFTQEQINLLPLIKEFSKDFTLVGGTAIALHIGHRRSIDFDLFLNGDFNNVKIKRKISRLCKRKIERIYVDEPGQYTISLYGVRITFFNFPYDIKSLVRLDRIIKIPNLLTLAALKAFALGRRPKWKDYVDLYFIIKNYYSINEIVKKGKEIFGNEFNEKIFREAIVYFKDINYNEKVVYLPGFETDDKIIKKALIDFSLQNE